MADRPDSADGIEWQEPAKELPPPKLHVTIVKRVIDDEVERHRHEDCQGLRIAETLSAHIERKTQYEQMHQQTDAAHRREHKETHRQKMAEHLFEQQNDEFLPHFRVQLALRSEEHTSELQSLLRISYAVLCLQKTHTYSE